MNNNTFKDFRVPGVAWGILIIIVIALIHENEASLPIDAFYADLIVGMLIGVLKGLSLGTDQLEQALNIIDAIRNRETRSRPRGKAGEIMPAPATVPESAVPERPNKMVRWLVG